MKTNHNFQDKPLEIEPPDIIISQIPLNNNLEVPKIEEKMKSMLTTKTLISLNLPSSSNSNNRLPILQKKDSKTTNYTNTFYDDSSKLVITLKQLEDFIKPYMSLNNVLRDLKMKSTQIQNVYSFDLKRTDKNKEKIKRRHLISNGSKAKPYPVIMVIETLEKIKELELERQRAEKDEKFKSNQKKNDFNENFIIANNNFMDVDFNPEISLNDTKFEIPNSEKTVLRKNNEGNSLNLSQPLTNNLNCLDKSGGEELELNLKFNSKIINNTQKNYDNNLFCLKNLGSSESELNFLTKKRSIFKTVRIEDNTQDLNKNNNINPFIQKDKETKAADLIKNFFNKKQFSTLFKVTSVKENKDDEDDMSVDIDSKENENEFSQINQNYHRETQNHSPNLESKISQSVFKDENNKETKLERQLTTKVTDNMEFTIYRDKLLNKYRIMRKIKYCFFKNHVAKYMYNFFKFLREKCPELLSSDKHFNFQELSMNFVRNITIKQNTAWGLKKRTILEIYSDHTQMDLKNIVEKFKSDKDDFKSMFSELDESTKKVVFEKFINVFSNLCKTKQEYQKIVTKIHNEIIRKLQKHGSMDNNLDFYHKIDNHMANFIKNLLK